MSRRRVPAHIAHGTETAVDDYRCPCAVCVEMNSIKRHRGNLRPARLRPDRQRVCLHLTIHPRPQRLRAPTGQSGHHPERRPPRTPANPRQDRTLPPNPQTVADPTTPPHHRRQPTAGPARHLPPALQHRPTPRRPAPRPHTTTGSHRPARSHPHRHHHAHLPHPPRHRRPIRQTHPAPRQPTTPPRHRPHPAHTPQQPPHRPRPQLLTRHRLQIPRPAAGVFCLVAFNEPTYAARLRSVWLWKPWRDRWSDTEAGIDVVAKTWWPRGPYTRAVAGKRKSDDGEGEASSAAARWATIGVIGAAAIAGIAGIVVAVIQHPSEPKPAQTTDTAAPKSSYAFQ